MKIVGLSEKGAKWLPIIISTFIFLLASGIYLYKANTNVYMDSHSHRDDWSYNVRVLDLKNKYTNETRTILHVHGDWATGIADDINEALTKHKVDEVVLSSPGGVGYEGYLAGQYLSNHGAKVRVAKGTYCLSACAIAFLGGADYKINDGILGFHRGWIMDSPYKDQNEAFANGQIAGDYHVYYFVANGFNLELPNKIMNKTDENTFLVFTKEDELKEFFVRTDHENGTTPIKEYLEWKNIDVKIWGLNEASNHLSNNTNPGDWKIAKEVLSLNNN